MCMRVCSSRQHPKWMWLAHHRCAICKQTTLRWLPLTCELALSGCISLCLLHFVVLHFVVLTGIFRERFPMVAFTKKQICDCGCLGRCTFDWIFKIIAWSFEALLAKKFPAKDHNGDPFPKGSYRDRMKNKDLNIAGLCIGKFGDWAWFKQVLSLKGWRGEGAQNSVAGCVELASKN